MREMWSRMRILEPLKGKNIRFNPRPFSNLKLFSSSKLMTENETNFVNLHLEVAKEVDALLLGLEQETIPQELEMPPEGEDLTSRKIVFDTENNI